MERKPPPTLAPWPVRSREALAGVRSRRCRGARSAVRVYAGIDPGTRNHLPHRVTPAGPGAADTSREGRARGSLRRSTSSAAPAPAPRSTNCSIPTSRFSTTRSSTAMSLSSATTSGRHRRRSGGSDQWRDPGLVLSTARPLSHALQLQAPHRAPHDGTARLRRPLQCACVPPAVRSVAPQDPGDPERGGKRAVRWEWIGRNPFELAEPIAAPRSEPKPPTAEQAAAISAEAWRDHSNGGMMVWLYMTTGARRGEMCALRWDPRFRYRRGGPGDQIQYRPARQADLEEGHQDPSTTSDRVYLQIVALTAHRPPHCANGRRHGGGVVSTSSRHSWTPRPG